MVAGTIIRNHEQVTEIRIAYTQYPQQHFADAHDARMQQNGIGDLATNRKYLPIKQGSDVTFQLLFSGMGIAPNDSDVTLVERLCTRLPQVARILAVRSRKNKKPFMISDEYDVQDLLHAVLRGYLKYSVQEDPLPKMAGAKSSRTDLSVEEIGVLVEVKYVHGPADQKRIFEEFSQDLLLYSKWDPLKHLIFLIYNSADLRDAEAFEKLTSEQELGGKRFRAVVVLA